MLSPLPVSPHLQLPLCFPLGPTSVSTIFSGTTGLRGILNYSIKVRFILHLRLPLLPSISDPFVMILLLLYTLSSFEKILSLFEQVQTIWCMVSLSLARLVCSVEHSVSVYVFLWRGVQSELQSTEFSELQVVNLFTKR